MLRVDWHEAKPSWLNMNQDLGQDLARCPYHRMGVLSVHQHLSKLVWQTGL